MDEYIKREDALNALLSEMVGTGYQARAMDAIKFIPFADVVPKSEFEKLVQDGTRLGQENETLKDNNEHLAVILEETKAEVEKLQNELVIWKQNRFNLFQRLECYEMVRQKVAREIFEELDNLKKQYIKGDIDEHKFIVRLFLLKKKYTEGEERN